MKKIIFNAESISEPLSGIGRYAYELATFFHNDKDFQVVYDHRVLLSKKFPQIKKTISLIKRIPILKFIIYLLFLIFRKINFKNIYLNAACKNFDFYFGPNYYVPKIGLIKKIVTIHDLSVFKFTKYHPLLRVKVVSNDILNSISSADLIFTDSKYTKMEIIDFFNLKDKKIVVAPAASKDIFMKYPKDVCNIFLNSEKLSYKGYILSVGTIEPRKNLNTLFDAYINLKPSLKKRYPLVIAGFSGWNNKDISKKIEKLIKEKSLIFLSNLADSELASLYAGAKLFVFPSIYEGFGLPILESMSSGTATICSNCTSMPEIINNPSYTFDPYNSPQINKLMSDLLSNEKLLKKNESEVYQRSKKYSWEKTYKIIKSEMMKL